MKVRYTKAIDTPLAWVPEGTEAELPDEEAKRLIADGLAVPVAEKAERAVKAAKAEKAVKE